MTLAFASATSPPQQREPQPRTAWAFPVARDGKAPPPTSTPVPPTLTPTPAPTTEPAPVSAFASGPRTVPRTEVRTLARAAGFTGWQLDYMVALAECESGRHTHAVGLQGERGLWQIHPVHGWRSTFDPLGNAQAAYHVSRGGTDFTPWPNCP